MELTLAVLKRYFRTVLEKRLGPESLRVRGHD